MSPRRPCSCPLSLVLFSIAAELAVGGGVARSLRGAGPPGPAVAAAVALRERAALDPGQIAPQTLFCGRILEVRLPEEGAPAGGTQGFLLVAGTGGARKLFRVSTYTLILIRDRHDRLWAGRLSQLRANWDASVAFDLEEAAGMARDEPYTNADNMIVDAFPDDRPPADPASVGRSPRE